MNRPASKTAQGHQSGLPHHCAPCFGQNKYGQPAAPLAFTVEYGDGLRMQFSRIAVALDFVAMKQRSGGKARLLTQAEAASQEGQEDK